jgi:hypothetical protein
MIEKCFELGLEAYEFSGAEADYERRFATAEHRRCRLHIYRRGPLGSLRYAVHRWLRPPAERLRSAIRERHRRASPG